MVSAGALLRREHGDLGLARLAPAICVRLEK